MKFILILCRGHILVRRLFISWTYWYGVLKTVKPVTLTHSTEWQLLCFTSVLLSVYWQLRLYMVTTAFKHRRIATYPRKSFQISAKLFHPVFNSHGPQRQQGAAMSNHMFQSTLTPRSRNNTAIPIGPCVRQLTEWTNAIGGRALSIPAGQPSRC